MKNLLTFNHIFNEFNSVLDKSVRPIRKSQKKEARKSQFLFILIALFFLSLAIYFANETPPHINMIYFFVGIIIACIIIIFRIYFVTNKRIRKYISEEKETEEYQNAETKFKESLERYFKVNLSKPESILNFLDNMEGESDFQEIDLYMKTLKEIDILVDADDHILPSEKGFYHNCNFFCKGAMKTMTFPFLLGNSK
ncbi:MAG: hypothetical protein NTZ44_00190 [Candidatus Nomurabacteria bacterium]|nr:hypothetical protein [Candidatus Nomurabacteria bacterium]